MRSHRRSASILSVARKKPKLTLLEALRLSPRDTVAYALDDSYVGWRRRMSAVREQAVGWFRRSIEANHKFSAYFILAASLAQLGRLDEARSAVKAGPRAQPGLHHLVASAPPDGESDDPTYLAQRERILEGMRKAGVPEQ